MTANTSKEMMQLVTITVEVMVLMSSFSMSSDGNLEEKVHHQEKKLENKIKDLKGKNVAYEGGF